MSETPRPSASPAQPTGDAPPGEGLTPAEMVDPRVVRLVDRREQRLREKILSEMRVQAAKAVAEQGNGKPVFSPKLTKWFFAGLTLCGAITTALIGDASVPPWVLKVAAVGSLTFGGLLAAGPGFRKGAGK